MSVSAIAETADASEQEIEAAVEQVKSEYTIPQDEAEALVASDFGIDRDELTSDGSSDSDGSDDTELLLGEIGYMHEGAQPDDDDGEETTVWGHATVEVLDVWGARNASMEFVGLVGDRTGRRKLTIWDGAEMPSSNLEEGDVLEIESACIDKYVKGNSDDAEVQYSLKVPRTGSVEVVDGNPMSVVGRIRDVSEGTGLVQRCSHDDCSRVLNDGKCPEHGDVDGDNDLRIRATLSVTDTDTELTTYFGREATEDILGITLEKAEERARAEMSRDILEGDVRSALIGRRVEIDGRFSRNNQMLFVNEYELEERADVDDIIASALDAA